MSRIERCSVTAAIAIALFLSAYGPLATAQPSLSDLREEVTAAERGFAKTMADRDHAAFSRFVAEDAVFFSPKSVLRGRAQVADGWKAFFTAATAPFSWEPDSVEVVGGTLALSSGPVRDPKGNRIGTFNSVWRRELDGRWRVIFDKGCPPCDCK